MSQEKINPRLIKSNIDLFTKIVKRPPVTEKILGRPPFRFLFDLTTMIIKTTGYLRGLYTEEEFNFDNVNSNKETKMAFLDKLIDVIGFISGKVLDVKSAKIVAGVEVEKTNKFLNEFAKCVTDKKPFLESVDKVRKGLKLNASVGNKQTVKSVSNENRKNQIKDNQQIKQTTKQQSNVMKRVTDKTSANKTGRTKIDSGKVMSNDTKKVDKNSEPTRIESASKITSSADDPKSLEVDSTLSRLSSAEISSLNMDGELSSENNLLNKKILENKTEHDLVRNSFSKQPEEENELLDELQSNRMDSLGIINDNLSAKQVDNEKNLNINNKEDNGDDDDDDDDQGQQQPNNGSVHLRETLPKRDNNEKILINQYDDNSLNVNDVNNNGIEQEGGKNSVQKIINNKDGDVGDDDDGDVDALINKNLLPQDDLLRARSKTKTNTTLITSSLTNSMDNAKTEINTGDVDNNNNKRFQTNSIKSARPKSSRPAPPRVMTASRSRLNQLMENRSEQLGDNATKTAANVWIPETIDHESDEYTISYQKLQESFLTMDSNNQTIELNDTSTMDNKGQLVQQLLESKNVLEGQIKSNNNGQKMSVTSAETMNDIEKLRNQIQALCQSIGTLTKAMAYLHEDVTPICDELKKWQNEYEMNNKLISKIRTEINNELEPFKNELKQMEKQADDFSELIRITKANIFRNEQNISKLIDSV